jgi:hypothetical protein
VRYLYYGWMVCAVWVDRWAACEVWVDRWASCEVWVDRWAACEVWVDRWAGLRVGFININDMYNNDVGMGGAHGCEAYEVK